MGDDLSSLTIIEHLQYRMVRVSITTPVLVWHVQPLWYPLYVTYGIRIALLPHQTARSH